MRPDNAPRRAFVIACTTVATAVVLGPGAGSAQDALPLRVFVTTVEVPLLPRLPPEVHQQESTRTLNARSAKAAALRKQYGDNTKAWPNDAWDQFNEAADAHSAAVARADYESSDTRSGLEASLKDVVKEAGKSKLLTLVAGTDQADLVIAITGRRRASKAFISDNSNFVRFSLEPGGLANRARVIEAMRRHEWNGLTTKVILRPWGVAESGEFEAASPFGMRQAGEWVIGMVEMFARAQFGPPKK